MDCTVREHRSCPHHAVASKVRHPRSFFQLPPLSHQPSAISQEEEKMDYFQLRGRRQGRGRREESDACGHFCLCAQASQGTHPRGYFLQRLQTGSAKHLGLLPRVTQLAGRCARERCSCRAAQPTQAWHFCLCAQASQGTHPRGYFLQPTPWVIT